MTADPAREAYERGIDQLGMNQLGPAFTSFGLAIELDHNFAEAYAARAIVCLRQGIYLQAISDFTKAIQNNPGLKTLHIHRAEAFTQLGDTVKAREDIDAALESDPANVDLFVKRAKMYFEAELCEKAAEDYTSALLALRAELQDKIDVATPGANNPGTRRLYAWREIEILSLRADCWLHIDEWVKAVADWDAILTSTADYRNDVQIARFAVEAANSIINALNDFGGAETHIDSELAEYAQAATDFLNSCE